MSVSYARWGSRASQKHYPELLTNALRPKGRGMGGGGAEFSLSLTIMNPEWPWLRLQPGLGT